ncbi:hypothetical protein TNIN_216961 [Trichonephila inaurata madagascariensis]|uniref:THAP-type domain-containing protein n=1 Tax=Trichonephila inaurata madagascariensis TaxID=2747483 RepID=A0A8X7BX23_9ARAC|nr:hypothetical protein TNIN_216961 [Trichonephila inaurata madagascariensis]
MAYCAAYGCTNTKRKEEFKSKSFFKFPVKNPGLLKAWVKMIRRENFKPSAHSLITSKRQALNISHLLIVGSQNGALSQLSSFFKKQASSRRILDRCKSSTSVM